MSAPTSTFGGSRPLERRWSEPERAIVRANYQRLMDKDLAALLGEHGFCRTDNSVKNERVRMGLKRVRTSAQRSADAISRSHIPTPPRPRGDPELLDSKFVRLVLSEGVRCGVFSPIVLEAA